MSLRALFLVLASALLALPTLAQDAGEPDDGGSGAEDAGPPDCTPRCEGEELVFCDEGAADPVVRLDCSETGATCGLLSADWGYDCLLPEGAACEPGYAEGLSRCEGSDEATLCCVNDVCAEPSGSSDCRDFVPGAPRRPDSAGNGANNTQAGGCLSGIPGLGLLPVLLGLRLARRNRRGLLGVRAHEGR